MLKPSYPVLLDNGDTGVRQDGARVIRKKGITNENRKGKSEMETPI